jgi:D-amino-acid dehydrogenase
MPDNLNRTTVVIGAGIIGASIAHTLQKTGRQVVLIDRDAPGHGASYGNMASIAVTEFMPVARPSIWRRMPCWMFDPAGPIRISPLYIPKMVPWLLRFMMASRSSRVSALETHGAALCGRALSDTQALLDEIELSDHLSQTGCLSLYASEREFGDDRERIDMLDRFGFNYKVLGSNALRDLEPEISSSIQKAVLLPDNRTVANPYQIVEQLVSVFSGKGGKVVCETVTGFTRSDAITGVQLSDGTLVRADEVVISAGAYTGRLSRMLGEPIPLETERGYSTQINAPEISLNHSIIWPAKAFMVSPTAGGIRVGGTVEMAGLDAAPNYDRAKITVKRAKEALPNLKVGEVKEWMGHRPALPDTIPIISASAKIKGVFYATGHGHLGVTYAATTARLLGQLMAGEATDLDLAPFRVNRF